jgi:DsbC/DsbD-like thiol-disulfide interchange protein
MKSGNIRAGIDWLVASKSPINDRQVGARPLDQGARSIILTRPFIHCARLFLQVVRPIVAACLFGGLLASAPAWGQASDWVESEGGRLRIVAAVDPDVRQVRAILDIDLKPGWKTYWRDPGPSGIPPTIDVAASDNIDSVTLHFPAPHRVDDGYGQWAGYPDPVALPLVLERIDEDADTTLRARLFLGICETICIPLQADITLELTPDASRLSKALVARAFDALPSAPTPTHRLSDLRLSEDGRNLTVAAHVPSTAAANGPDLFAAAPEGFSFGVPVRTASDSDGPVRFTIPILRQPDGATLPGHNVAMTLTTATRAINQTLTVEQD